MTITLRCRIAFVEYLPTEMSLYAFEGTSRVHLFFRDGRSELARAGD